MSKKLVMKSYKPYGLYGDHAAMTGSQDRWRMTAALQEETSGRPSVELPKRAGSVSSLMQEAAVRLLDAATVSNPSHC
jgi:hypothetical protein